MEERRFRGLERWRDGGAEVWGKGGMEGWRNGGTARRSDREMEVGRIRRMEGGTEGEMVVWRDGGVGGWMDGGRRGSWERAGDRRVGPLSGTGAQIKAQGGRSELPSAPFTVRNGTVLHGGRSDPTSFEVSYPYDSVECVEECDTVLACSCICMGGSCGDVKRRRPHRDGGGRRGPVWRRGGHEGGDGMVARVFGVK